MNIEKLEVGKSFKNYKELCAELGWEVKASVGTKNAQFKELDRYCKYTKIGHRITITEVFEKPLDKVDGRGKSEGSRRTATIYGDLVQLLILDLLARDSNKHISISRSKLMLATSIVNGNYAACGQHPMKLSKYTNVQIEMVYDFLNTSRSSIKGIIETALKNLEDKRIIICDIVTKVEERTTRTHRLATPIEKETIMRIEKTVLDELGYEKFSKVRFSKDWINYKNKVKHLLHEETNIEFHYKAYDIVANKDFLDKESKSIADYILKETDKDEIKDELNYTVCKSLNANAEKRQEQGFMTSGKLFRSDVNYTKNIGKLISLLVNHTAEDIVSSVINVGEHEELTEEQMELIDDLFI